MGYKEKECVTCGKLFVPNSGKQIRCSECARIVKNERNKERLKVKKKSAKCKMCGKEFIASRANQEFCSSTCYNTYISSSNNMIDHYYSRENMRKLYPNNELIKEIKVLLCDFNINMDIPQFTTVAELENWKKKIILQYL